MRLKNNKLKITSPIFYGRNFIKYFQNDSKNLKKIVFYPKYKF